jgi:hypothetical protein
MILTWRIGKLSFDSCQIICIRTVAKKNCRKTDKNTNEYIQLFQNWMLHDGALFKLAEQKKQSATTKVNYSNSNNLYNG